jgi:hypothetical protein
MICVYILCVYDERNCYAIQQKDEFPQKTQGNSSRKVKAALKLSGNGRASPDSIFLVFERGLQNTFRLDRGLQDAHPHALGYFDLERVVPNLADRTEESADGDHLVAPRDSAYQSVVLFLALALGPDDEEVKNEDKYPQRQKHTHDALRASRSPAFSATAAATWRSAGIRYRRRCLFRHTIFLLVVELLVIIK